MAKPFHLEVCVDSFESGLRAHLGGAHRIELCSALSEGGLTPSLGTLVQLKKRIPPNTTQIFVMLRPTRGCTFRYEEDEMQSILLDINEFKRNGADGFVFGALLNEEEIDVANCKRVIEAAGPLPVTFHRAFDVLQGDAVGHLHTISDLGFKRLLTSGQFPTAVQGLENISKWSRSFPHLIIMPGSGVNPGNLNRLVLESGCTEFHSSCKERTDIPLNPIISDLQRNFFVDTEIVQRLVAILKGT